MERLCHFTILVMGPAAEKGNGKRLFFAGEERMLGELNDLSLEDATPKKANKPARPEPVAEVCAESDGQPLQVDFTTPPRHYSTEFQVRDHKMAAPGVWLYNNRDGQVSALAASTEYISTGSPGKSGGSFQMAPGMERHKHEPWPEKDEDASIEDLEARLNKLRGFKL